jgi:hypothetical protein
LRQFAQREPTAQLAEIDMPAELAINGPAPN